MSVSPVSLCKGAFVGKVELGQGEPHLQHAVHEAGVAQVGEAAKPKRQIMRPADTPGGQQLLAARRLCIQQTQFPVNLPLTSFFQAQISCRSLGKNACPKHCIPVRFRLSSFIQAYINCQLLAELPDKEHSANCCCLISVSKLGS